MKKYGLKITIVIMVIIIVILSAITINKNYVTNDEKEFKREYEKYNGKTNPSSNKKYFDLNIDYKNGVKYVTAKEAINILSRKTGIVYFGFPQCPWCRNIVEVLLEAKKEVGVDTLYYYNALEIRDEKVLKDNEIITSKEGTKEYYKILELLGDKASVYEGLNDDSIKRLYFPTVVFVKEGQIIDIHVSTVDSQKDPYKKLTKDQKQELKNIYIKNIRKINSVDCSNNNVC